MAKIIIIGAGPAGVSASLYTARAGIATTLFYRGSGALEKAEKIENYYGFAEPVAGMELEAAGRAGAERLGAALVEEEIVGLGIPESGQGFVVTSEKKTYTANALILAAGAARKAPAVSGLAALEGRGVSYCAVCDAFFYRGKVVAVLGDGQYARHEVDTLLPIAGKVLLFTNGKKPTVAFPAEVEIYTAPIAELLGGDRLQGLRLQEGQTVSIEGLFVAYGTAGSTDLARKIGAVFTAGRIAVDAGMATNIPGLFAAGDCTGGLLQVAKAVYEGAAAGLSAVKYIRGLQEESL